MSGSKIPRNFPNNIYHPYGRDDLFPHVNLQIPGFCHHTLYKYCYKCNPDITCNHGLFIHECWTCNVQHVCIHGHVGSNHCMICSPKKLCEHMKIKDLCKYCKYGMCHHGEIKHDCQLCQIEFGYPMAPDVLDGHVIKHSDNIDKPDDKPN
jgi:hypothetical protein